MRVSSSKLPFLISTGLHCSWNSPNCKAVCAGNFTAGHRHWPAGFTPGPAGFCRQLYVPPRAPSRLSVHPHTAGALAALLQSGTFMQGVQPYTAGRTMTRNTSRLHRIALPARSGALREDVRRMHLHRSCVSSGGALPSPYPLCQSPFRLDS